MRLGKDLDLKKTSEGRRINLGRPWKGARWRDDRGRIQDERRRTEEEDEDWESLGECGERRRK